MFCQNCGETISERAEICPSCGVRVKGAAGEDKPNIAVNILSFCCVPLLGIILYFVWKDTKPIAARSAGMWALISIGLMVVIYFLFFVLGAFSQIQYY